MLLKREVTILNIDQTVLDTECCHSQKQQDSPADAEPKTKNPRSDTFGTSFSESISRSKTPSSMFDSMTKTEKDLIDTHLARAIYASGSPFHLVENNYWKIFMNKLRPAYKLPSRHEVSNLLLDNEFSKISANVKEMVATADYLGLMCDGWSSLRNEAIINFVMTLPSSSSILWKTLPTGKTIILVLHSGEYMANEIKKVLEEINPNKVLGIVTDNAANMKNAWTRLKDCYPHLHCYGCILHGLDLLFTDFLKLATLSVSMSQATDIVKEIKNSHLSVAAFRDIQKKSAGVVTCITLKLPGSTVACLDSILKNKQPLKTLAISENSGPNSATKNILLSDIFWDRVEGFFKLLSPRADAIKKTESNAPMSSTVVETFHFLEDHIFKNVTVSPFSKKEEEEAKKIFKKRKEFCLTEIHLAANILDLKFQSRVLTGEQKIDACEVIHNIAAIMPEVNKEIMMYDLAIYQSKGGIFLKSFIWTAVGITQPINWWKGLCSFTELSKVASRILQLPASSAACERSFSTYSNIHSAKRNRLTTVRAGKLVLISQNLKLENIEHQLSKCTSTPWSESEAVYIESDSDLVYEPLDEDSLGQEDSDSESTSI
ncbi:uncharacterized protein LOC124818995 [Hydra vulgaris]|uniref:uncharacterized protein LOC124818995 n=1 Tax=Hydra vulgaris TaxID=6087 RepID=UPI001F5E5A68|nr:uncharacterized protein LOC124818995 [Hydra vulgaris]